jgi:flagellar hook-basal body complex protein FliE
MAIEGILSTLGSLSSTASAGVGGASTSGAAGLTSVTGDSGSGLDFGATLNKLVSAVDSSDAQANQATLSMIDGSADVHDAMIALQRADMTFQLTVQIRNKLVNAYQDIMRMPV